MLKTIKVSIIIIAILLLLPFLVGCKVEYSLRVSVYSGQGVVTPSFGTYTEGTAVTITAIPDSGWEFSHWEGKISGNGNPATIRMESNKIIEAYFVETQPPAPTPTSSPTSEPTPTPTISKCAPGCPSYHSEDGYCETACNNAACNYDNGDCSSSTSTQTPSPTPTPTSTPNPTALITISYSSTTQIGTAMFPDELSPGFVYIIVNMTIQNNGYESFDIYPQNDFYAVADSVLYSTTPVSYLENELPGEFGILDGGTVTGSLAFEVPEGTTAFSMQYEGYGNIQLVQQ